MNCWKTGYAFLATNRRTAIAFLAYVVLTTGFTMVFALTPWFVAKEKGGAAVGTVMTGFNATLLIGYFYTPRVLRYGVKRVTLLMLSCHAACFMLLWTRQYELVWVLDGLFYAPAVVGMDKLLRSQISRDLNPEDRIAKELRLLGWFTGVSAATTSAAVPLGRWLLNLNPFWWIGAGAVAIVISILLVCTLPSPSMDNAGKKSVGRRGDLARLLLFSLPYLAAIPVTLVAFNTFFLSYTQGNNELTLSGVMLASGIISMVFPVKDLAKRYHLVIQAGIATLALALWLVIAAPSNTIALGIAGVLIGLAVGAGKLAARAKLNSLEGSDSAQTAASYLVGSLAGVLSPYPLGAVADHWEYTAVWWSLLPILALASIALLIQRWWQRENPRVTTENEQNHPNEDPQQRVVA